MNLTTVLLGMSSPGMNEDPGLPGPDIELPEIEGEEDPIGGFDPEEEVYQGQWESQVQLRALVGAHRISEEVRVDLGLPAEGAVALYAMSQAPENTGSAYVVVDEGGWESWQFLKQEIGGEPMEVTAVITSEIYAEGMLDLFGEEMERDALHHAFLVDMDLVNEDMRQAFEIDTPYVLAAPGGEAAQSGGDFQMGGGWGLMAPLMSETPWGDFSSYATSRPDGGSSVGSMPHMGERVADGHVEMGHGWEIRVAWEQNAPWDMD